MNKYITDSVNVRMKTTKHTKKNRKILSAKRKLCGNNTWLLPLTNFVKVTFNEAVSLV